MIELDVEALKTMQPTDEELQEVYRRVAIPTHEFRHSGFLIKFAEALIRAGSENFQLLKPVALELAKKYNLMQQL